MLPLRWAAPDALRRLALFQRGYHVYRMSRAFAEAHGFHTTPPGAAAAPLARHLESRRREAHQHRADLPPRNLNAAEAANVAGDLKTIFFTDANGADENLGARFRNGDAFYYFITARDLLGREGAVSPAGFAEVYELTPLDTPRDVHAENDFVFMPGNPSAGADQRLIVSWKQADNTGATRPVLRYLVYRWTSVNDLQLHADDPAPQYQPIATLAHTANNARAELQGRRPRRADRAGRCGRVFFYSVRAEADAPVRPGALAAQRADAGVAARSAQREAPTNPPLFSPCYALGFNLSVDHRRGDPGRPRLSDRTHRHAQQSARRLGGIQGRRHDRQRGAAAGARLFRRRADVDYRHVCYANLPRSVGAIQSVVCNVGTSRRKNGASSSVTVTASENTTKLTVTFTVQNNPAPPDADCSPLVAHRRPDRHRCDRAAHGLHGCHCRHA